MGHVITFVVASEELEILESIKEGQQAAREGRTKTQEEVEQLFGSWNSK